MTSGLGRDHVGYAKVPAAFGPAGVLYKERWGGGSSWPALSGAVFPVVGCAVAADGAGEDEDDDGKGFEAATVGCVTSDEGDMSES